MIKTTAQIKINAGERYLHPVQDDVSELRHNEPVEITIKRLSAVKQRSVIQFGLLMKACEVVSNNTEDPSWDTKEKVKIQIKEKADYKDYSKAVTLHNGFTYIPYRSFSFSDLKHFEACKVFQIGFEYMASFLGYDDVEEFIEFVKSHMHGNY